MGAKPRPLLVIVSGAPATGKTTLAKGLATALGLPLLAKDDIKETLADSLPPKSVGESRALGSAAYKLLYRLARQMLDSRQGIVLESNFWRGASEAELRPLVERSVPRLLHLWAPMELAVRRYRERSERGERHPAHFDGDRIAPGQTSVPDEVGARFDQPLDLGVPTMVIDTTSGYVNDLEPILLFVARGWPERR